MARGLSRTNCPSKEFVIKSGHTGLPSTSLIKDEIYPGFFS
jgi:hypothetical protein